MRPEFFDRVMSGMGNCRPDNETIVAGVDLTGAHIYEVDRWGDLICQDAAGFAAIGAVRRHAESQFMFGKHAAWKLHPATLLLTYSAKRRAEVAPGVGADTDMVTVVGLGGFRWLRWENITYLKEIYDHMYEVATQATLEADLKIENDFKELAAAQAAQIAQATANTQDETTPPPKALAAETEDSPSSPIVEVSAGTSPKPSGEQTTE